jgi:hypothetical protein
MQAREFYSPSERNVPARDAFARWTKRVLEQPALAVARELAGLSEHELDDLEAEFVRRPIWSAECRRLSRPVGEGSLKRRAALP